MAKSYTLALIPIQKERYVFNLNTLRILFRSLLSIDFRGLRKSWQQIRLYQNQNRKSEIELLKLNKIYIELIKNEEEFIFHLNDAQLEAICKVKDQDKYDYKLKALKLRELLIDVLQTILPSSRIGKRKNTYNFSYTFIFKTCYYFDYDTIQKYNLPQKHNPTEVVRTVTSLDGDIIDQIHKGYLFYYRYADIVSSHHWLSNKVVRYLGTCVLDISNFVEIVVAFVGIFVAFVAIALDISLLISILLTNWRITSIWIVLQIVLYLVWPMIQRWLFPRIRRLLWQQLINPRSFLRGWLGRFLLKVK